MESMVKQIRLRFSGLGGDSEPTPENKSGKRKKTQSWLGGQLSGHKDPNGSDGTFETVIAASAYAVTSVEEEELLNQKKSPSKQRETSLAKVMSKEDSLAGPRVARKDSKKLTGETSMKKPEASKAPADQKMPEKVTGTLPSARTAPSFSGTYPNGKEIVRSESSKDKLPKPTVSFKEKPGPTTTTRDRTGTSKENRGTEAKADAWERAEMDKIEKRYEKLRSTILSWENEKQTNARRRLERKERRLEEKRARAQQEYRIAMARINRITGGARASAEERRRNDEMKTKEKAKIFRTTGKMPVTCYCF